MDKKNVKKGGIAAKEPRGRSPAQSVDKKGIKAAVSTDKKKRSSSKSGMKGAATTGKKAATSKKDASSSKNKRVASKSKESMFISLLIIL